MAAAAVGGIVVLSLLVAGTAAARPELATCGTERWTVKTLQDRPHLLPVVQTTVAHLVRLRAPAYLPAIRLPSERHVYAVTAAVTLVRPKDDDDYHLILQSGGHHMIAETPMFSCTSRAAPKLRREMARARAALRVCRRARITGVLFFDYDHGQTGVAPNAVELHPVLAFRCLRP